MRVALLHSFYASDKPSGENTVVEAQAAALAEAGHDVLLLGRTTDDESQLPGYPVRAAWRTISNRGPNPTKRLSEFAPDVVHVHNTVPNISAAWVRSWRGPLVHTLHNFRPLCSNGLLFRDGQVCTECPDGNPLAALEHACYRDSRVATLPIALRNARGLASNPLLARADALIVLSEYVQDIYRGYGVGAERLRVIPNGVSAVHAGSGPVPAELHWLAVGRLSAEKGFAELLAGWPAEAQLDIVGDGPLRASLEASAGPGVRFLGQLPAADVRTLMPGYGGVVFSSVCPENAPLVLVEAWEAGLPTLMIATSPHAPEPVKAGVARTVGIDGAAMVADEFRSGFCWVADGGQILRDRSRAYYERHYTQKEWVARLLALYREVGASG